MTRRLVPVLVAAALVGAMAAAPAPAAGRERPFSTAYDDWEPAVAADRVGHVFLATTRYGGTPACTACPKSFIAFRSSTDGGRTFGPAGYLCACAGFKAQNDPVLATDDRGRLYATWMNDYHVSFARSDDHGRTWTPYRVLDRGLRFSDKPWIGVSASGRDVYVVFNQSTPYAVASHDAGRTWSAPVAASSSPRYFFSGGTAVLPNGTVLSAQDAYHQNDRGNITLVVLRSADRGRSWTPRLVGRSYQQPACPPGAGCPKAYLGAQIAVAGDRAGTAYLLFNANLRPGGPHRLYLRTSSDGGLTWTPPRLVAPAVRTVDHEFPMIVATGRGDVRIGWMDDRTGRWNTFLRRSTDGGRSWGAEERLSDRAGGAPYKTAAGFAFPYGDYGQLALGPTGRTWAAWGEGPSYTGPGGTWYALSG